MRGLQLPVCSLDKPFKNNIYSEGNVRNEFFTLKVGRGGKNGKWQGSHSTENMPGKCPISFPHGNNNYLLLLFCHFISMVNSYGNVRTVSFPNHTIPGQAYTF